MQVHTKQLRVIDCGLAGYGQILDLQSVLCEQRRNKLAADTILLVEHLPVITLGARKTANKLSASREYISTKGIEVFEIRRGGGITAHNPGQLVIYPILNLFELHIGISEYIARLEQIGQYILKDTGVEGERRKGLPGLWVGEKKIASIGVRVSRGITSHGIALNINNDLSIFDLFVPCGLDGVKMTSAYKETGKICLMNELKQRLHFLLIENFLREHN